MDDSNRFSILILEKDVLEYNHFKNKFYEYDSNLKKCHRFLFRKYDQNLKMKFYEKYINKLKFLEKNYRKTQIYTKYHEDIEYPHNRIKPVNAYPVHSLPIPSAPILPSIKED
jgi:hypothetical protein